MAEYQIINGDVVAVTTLQVVDVVNSDTIRQNIEIKQQQVKTLQAEIAELYEDLETVVSLEKEAKQSEKSK